MCVFKRSYTSKTQRNRCCYEEFVFIQHRFQSSRREQGKERTCTAKRSSAMPGAGGRLVRKATNSSSTSGNTSPYPIPSLKFPFLWEAKKPSHKITRSAEQRAALITLGAAGTGTTPDKRQGVFLSESEVKSIDLLSPLAYEITRRMILRQFVAAQLALERQSWPKIIERIIHQVIVNSQSFTLFGVAGSLIGSVPLFVEGCAVVVKAFLTRFHDTSHTDHGETIRLLIESINMFLIGTALLTFGMGMYIMFNGSHSIQKQALHVDTSHLGAFNLKKLKEGAKIKCIMQGKARIGHAILLLLQVGIVEKFKSVPLVTGLDMACFAGAVFASSASIFILSKLDRSQQESKQSFT